MKVHVPYTLKFISDVVGEEETFAFIENVAGQRLFIPKKAQGSTLEKSYGVDIAAVLSEEMGGTFWEVPLYKDWRVRKLTASGLSHNEVAQRLSMTRSHVRQVMKRRPADIRAPDDPPPVIDLFPQLNLF